MIIYQILDKNLKFKNYILPNIQHNMINDNLINGVNEKIVILL